MRKLFKNPSFIILLSFWTCLGVFLLSMPFWAWGTSKYTDKYGLEMPALGDVGWDDAVRINHKIFEVVTTPILEGNYVASGVTPTDGGGLVVSWSAGWIKMGGVSKWMASGSTTIVDGTVNWLSAVTPGGGTGVTMQARSTEYDLPSGASGFAHVPIAIVFTAGADIARFKDVRYIPRILVYEMDQDVNTGATPTFSGARVNGVITAYAVQAESGLSMPIKANPAMTTKGRIAYSDRLNAIVFGDGTNNVMGPTSGETIYVVISSPDSLDDSQNQPIWMNRSGTSFIVTAVYLNSQTGVTCSILTGASTYAYRAADGSKVISDAGVSTYSGTSVYTFAKTSGTTTIPPDRPVLLDFSGVTPTNWLEIIIAGRYEGNRSY